jgi:hypothetical protein
VSAHALVVEIRAHPGQKAALLARLRQHRDNVLAKEPGCQYFDLLEVEGDEDTLFLYEVYGAPADGVHARERLIPASRWRYSSARRQARTRARSEARKPQWVNRADGCPRPALEGKEKEASPVMGSPI